MNIEQLEAVNAVVEFGSFRAAAERLNRSQPALSLTIKNLEEEFDLLIFDRSAYRPKLTEAGTAFLNVARATLNAAHYATRVAHELGKNKAETKLKVSVDPLLSLSFIEKLAFECSRPVLPVNLILEKTILQGGYKPLIDGEIDLAFGPCHDNDEKIEKINLEVVTLLGVISRKLLQEKQKAAPEFLNKQPQILVYDKTVDEIAAGRGHKIFVPDHFTKLRLIQSGIGWGRISKSEFSESEELVLIDKSICAPVDLELCLMRAKNRPIGPTARQIWTSFKNQVL